MLGPVASWGLTVGLVATSVSASTNSSADKTDNNRTPGAITVIVAGEAPVSVRTLDDAIVQARAMRRPGHTDIVTVNLPSGIFRLMQPLQLGPADSNLVIRGASNGGTVLSGAAEIVTQPRIGRVETIDLAGIVGRSLYLVGLEFGKSPKYRNPLVFQGDKRIEFAAWPLHGYAKGWRAQPVPGGLLLTYPKGSVPTLPSSVLVGGYLLADWAYEVDRGRPEPGGILLPGYRPQFPPKSPPRLRVLNVAGTPVLGRMVLDEAKGQLTISPAQDDIPIDLAVAPSVLIISGAHDVQIDSIRIEKSTDTGVRVSNAHAVSFNQCSVGLTGGSGITIDASTDVTVQHCVLRGIGASGILVFAGDRTTLKPGNIAVRDSVVEQYAMDQRTYQPGIGLNGVGNVVDHSIVAVAPHTGIMIGGNEQTITASEVTAVGCETEDVGAIYMGRDWTMRGIRIDGNFIHDTGEAGGGLSIGVYLDDQFSGAIITRNVFLRLGWGILLGGGRDNRIENNVFAQMSGAAIHYDARGLGPQRTQALPGGTLMTKFLKSPYNSAAWRARYVGLASLPSDHPGAPIGNSASGNWLISSPWLKGADGGFPLKGTPGHDAIVPTLTLSDDLAGLQASLFRFTGGTGVGPRGPLLFNRYRLSAPTCPAAGP